MTTRSACGIEPSDADGPIQCGPRLANSSASTRLETLSTTSASDLATKTEVFESWAHQVNLDPTIHQFIPQSTIFKPMQDIQLRSQTFPRCASDPDSDQFRFVTTLGQEWKDLLSSRLQSGEYPLHDDPHEFGPATFMYLFELCPAHERVCDLDEEGKERLGYDINLDLRLPSTTPPMFDGDTTTADGLGWIEIPDFEPCVASPDFLEAVSVVCVPLDVPNLVFIHFVASYTAKGSAEDRVKMAIVSALQQKKVLGLPDQFVFGMFQFDTDYLEVIAGMWQGDEMKIYKVGTYYLLDSVSVCQLYLVLRGIKSLGKVYEDEIVAAGPSLAKVARANLPSKK